MAVATEREGTCLAGAAHDWRIEWRATVHAWPGGTEHRTECRRCGLRHQRIEADPDPLTGDPSGTHYLPATDAWPDDPGDPDLTDPDARALAYKTAMAAGDAARAFAIAREPFPMDSPDWPEDARRPWGARRELARMALDAGEDAADADSDRRDFEAGDDLTWREVPAVEDAPPWDGEHDGGGRLPMAGDWREPGR